MHALKNLKERNPFRQFSVVALQVFSLIMIWLISNQASIFFHLPFSGGIVGLLLLVFLLTAGVIKPTVIELGGDLILANMLLYFIPLVVSLVQYSALFAQSGFRLIAAIGIGFMVVLSATALTVEVVCQIIRKRHFRRLVAHRINRTEKNPSIA